MIIPLFGPFAIHPYGLCIALGVSIALVLMLRAGPGQAAIPRDDLFNLINLSILAGIVGGRALSIAADYDQLDSWADLFAFWDGGFSILGSILAIVICVCVYAMIKKLSILAILDLFGLYAPLVQAFGRIGCYFAGCCHGIPTTQPWGITYTDPLSLAPLCIKLHPTQLYNVALLLFLFAGLIFMARRHPYPGTVFGWSILVLGLIRFATDFWRGDRGLLLPCGPLTLSTNQILSGLFMLFAVLLLVLARHRARRRTL
jgi:phosphatidylglycerol:prolipoprotein diacylglycerol transferase